MFAKIWLVTFPIGMPLFGRAVLSLSLSRTITYEISVVAFDDGGKKGEHMGIVDTLPEQSMQDAAVHVIEKFQNVGAPEPAIAVPLQKSLRAVDGPVQPLSLPAGPCIVEKDRIVDPFQGIVEKAVHKPVTDGSHRDAALFIVADGEDAVRAVPICPCRKVAVQLMEILFKIKAECLHLRRALLARPECQEASPER